MIVACIPAYNEEETIARIILLTKNYVDTIIVCDDGSTDLTGEIASGLGAILIKHTHRMGYGAAIQDLFNEAQKLGADIIISLDGDGQHDPNEIPELIEPIIKGNADLVVGSRFLGEDNNHIPRLRRVGIDAITRLTSAASGIKLGDAQSGFRAYSLDALGGLELTENGMGSSTEILLKAAKADLRIVEVPVTIRYEGLNTSTHNPLSHGIDVISSIIRLVIERRPLMYLGIPGIIILFVGIFFGIWMMQIYLNQHYIITNIALASLSFILIGFFIIFFAITLYSLSKLRNNPK